MRGTLRTVLVALAVALTTSTTAARSHHVIALAPVELVADGFLDLAGLVVDATGNVFVADRRAGTVTRIGPDHRRATVASRLKHPGGLALDESGRLLIAEEGAGRVVSIEADGRRTTLITGLKAPRWVVVDAGGTVYVAARRLTRAAIEDSEAEDADPDMILAWSDTRGLRVLADDFRRLEGLALGDGAIYAATKGRRPGRRTDGVVYKIPLGADGAHGIVVGPSNRLERPSGLACDRLGALYVSARALRTAHREAKELRTAQRDFEHVVAKLTPDGRVSLFASGLDDPQGVAFDASGNLYVADAGRVLRFRAPMSPTLDPAAEFTREPTVVVAGTTERHARVTATGDGIDVATTTGPTGGFTITVPLAADTANDFAIVATPFGGEGLSSAPAELAVTHDSAAPLLAFVAPTGGAFVRGVVSVQVQGSDAGSGLASLTLARGAHSLSTTISPSLPALTATATASWDTATLPDGTHMLVAAAIDRASNPASIQRTVLVDNTAPETSIVSGPAGAVAESTQRFVFTATDHLTPTPALQFSWRLDAGAWSPFTSATTVTLSGLTPGPHRFEVRARDQAGNEDTTPALRDFTISALRVTITDPSPGAMVAAGVVVVRGTVEGAGAEVGVAVNESVAAVAGGVFVAAVPVPPGPAILTAVATAPTGGTATASVAVTATGGVTADALRASPASGVAPLIVAFSVFGTPDSARVDIDADGNGTTDISDTRVEDQAFTFTAPGVYVATAVITDGSGVRTTAQTVIQVFDRVALDAMLQTKWTGMKAALRAGDIPRALDYLVDRRRADYDAAFRALAARLSAIDTILSDITLVRVRNAAAVFEMVRVDAGVVKSFQIRFALGGDGVWRLDSF